MTLEELREWPEEFVNAKEIASIIGCDPYALTIAARETPEKLGFPAMVIGKRTRFPRRAFIRYCEGRYHAEETQSVRIPRELYDRLCSGAAQAGEDEDGYLEHLLAQDETMRRHRRR